MSNLAIPAPSASTLPEQGIVVSLTAEIMNDLDNGRPTLVAYTEANAGDLCEVSPAHLLGMVEGARARLAAIELLAKEFEARTTLQAILSEHDVQMEEWDTKSLDPKMRRSFVAFAMLHKDGSRLVVVPVGQSPIERLAAVAELIADLRTAA